MKKCSLCENTNIKQDTLRTYHIECGKDFENTYIWKCEDCPFIGFEYYIPENAETVFYEMRYQESERLRIQRQ